MHVSVHTCFVVSCSMDLGLFMCGTGIPAENELDSTKIQVEILNVQFMTESMHFLECYHI